MSTYAWLPSPACCFTFVSDDALVTSGQWPNKLERYEAPSFDAATVSVDLKILTSVLVASPAGDSFFLGQKTAMLFDARTLKKKKVSLKAHTYDLGALAYSPSGAVVFTSGAGHIDPPDHSLRASDAVTGEQRGLIKNAGGALEQLLALDDSFVIGTGSETDLAGYDLEKGERVWRVKCPETRNAQGLVRRGDDVVCVMGGDEAQAYWVLATFDGRSGAERSRIPLFGVMDGGHVDGFVIRGEWAAVSMGRNHGSPDEKKAKVHWIHLTTGERGPVLEADEQTSGIALSPSGRWLAAYMCGDLGIAVFDLSELKELGAP